MFSCGILEKKLKIVALVLAGLATTTHLTLGLAKERAAAC
jgi:hypothetical protein